MNKTEIPAWMILGAFRYCLGRMTYQVSITASWLIENWNTIPENVQSIILMELTDEIRRDDVSRLRSEDPNKVHPLGMDMDRRMWDKLYAHILNETYEANK